MITHLPKVAVSSHLNQNMGKCVPWAGINLHVLIIGEPNGEEQHRNTRSNHTVSWAPKLSFSRTHHELIIISHPPSKAKNYSTLAKISIKLRKIHELHYLWPATFELTLSHKKPTHLFDFFYASIFIIHFMFYQFQYVMCKISFFNFIYLVGKEKGICTNYNECNLKWKRKMDNVFVWGWLQSLHVVPPHKPKFYFILFF